MSPQSTFKIPHALAALDAGVVTGADSAFAYDGSPQSFDAWRRDHTLATAMRYSVVWWFQRVAEKLGATREQDYLQRFAYGNADPSSGHRCSARQARLAMLSTHMRTVRTVLVQPKDWSSTRPVSTSSGTRGRRGLSSARRPAAGVTAAASRCGGSSATSAASTVHGCSSAPSSATTKPPLAAVDLAPRRSGGRECCETRDRSANGWIDGHWRITESRGTNG